MRISDWSSDVCSSDLVTIAVEGRQITQARAVGHVGNREILTVNAALGERPMDTEGQWAERPDVPSPEDSGPRMPRYPGTESRSEERLRGKECVRTGSTRGWPYH